MKWPSNWPHPLILAVIGLWGVNFPMVKLAELEFSTPSFTLIRYLLTVPAMFCICLIGRKDLRVPKKFWWSLALGGFLGSGIYMIMFLSGMKTTSSSQGAVALATAPIWVALMSALVGHEKVSSRLIGGSVMAFAGVTLAIFGAQGVGDGSALGTAICLGSAFVWGLSIIALRPAVNNLDPYVAFAWSLPSSILVMIPFGWHDMALVHWQDITWRGWLGCLYATFLSGVLGYSLYYKAVGIVGASRTSMVSYFIPIVAALAAWPLLGTAPHVMHLIGLAIVLLGIWIASTSKKPEVEAIPSGTIES